MYAAELAAGTVEEKGSVDDYLDAAVSLLLEVFGYSDTGADLGDLSAEAEASFLGVPISLRIDLDLASHFGFIRSVALKARLAEGGAS